ncbi:MAG TPA: ABC-2 family transporter protein [Clostridia bacterium]|nr:ABC-2 family transporter protein [Clostridia bacterium]
MSTEAEGRRNIICTHLKLIALYFKYNLQAAMEYRASFIAQSIGMFLNDTFFIFFWWVIFSKVSSLGGYGFKDVMLIWALAASTFGFLHIVFGNVRQLSRIIMNGELDTYLLQPKNVFINVHCSRMDFSAWGDFIYGYVLFFIVCGLNPLKLLLFTLFVIAGGLLTGAVMASADTLTFYIGNSSAITRIVTEFLLNFSLYPDSIFGREVKWIMYSLLPAGFIVFIPFKLLSAFSWYGLLGLMAVDTAYICLAWLFFKKGLKRYESGNLITTKL